MSCKRARLFRKGEMVQVCSERDILSTLAADGTLDGLPFMPEMRTYCGAPSRYSVARKRSASRGVASDG